MDILADVPEERGVHHFEFTLDNESVVLLAQNPTLNLSAVAIDCKYFAPKFHLTYRLKSLSHSISFTWVKSHLDDDHEIDNLSAIERNNIFCDREAKKHSLCFSSQELPLEQPPGLLIALRSEHGLVLERIQHHLTTSVYLDFVQYYLNLSPANTWLINWDLHWLILKVLAKRYHKIMRKLIWKRNSTQQTVFRQGRADSPCCLLCHQLEDAFHFLRCPIVRSSRPHIINFTKLKKKMAALDISAMMWQIICGYIEGGQLPFSGEEELDGTFLLIYETQSQVSFENFFLVVFLVISISSLNTRRGSLKGVRTPKFGRLSYSMYVKYGEFVATW